ncbi:YtxH domain-containing protein [Pectobacterium versatile]|uniref:YtxH domain-containing protein n=1 Tax=Pectobacterium versatile TaxID=2488639 RepID=UPI0030173E86
MSDELYLAEENPERLADVNISERKSALNIQQLLDQSLSCLIQSVIRTEKLKNSAKRVDGLIIGTGESDFTKGNTHYTLHIEDKDFQLIDVPGIEGNETRYVHLVKEAIAQAHMVVYVNGTNKKPETATAEKIKSYLEYGTQVYPLVNVRGFSEAYEFEEDRLELVQQGGAGDALRQTVEVLAPILGAEVLQKGHCVQGLLAFSALAYDDSTQSTQSTSIHPSRDHNLVVFQQEFFDVFPNRQEMRTFSQIDAVAQTIRNKVATFREDIVESNKGKVNETLRQYLGVLETQLAGHRIFLKGTEPEFDKCRVAFRNAIAEFERRIVNNRRNRWNTFFNELAEASDTIVEDDFGDSEAISQRIQREFKTRRISVEEEMLKDTEQAVEVLQQQMLQAVERLLEDIKHVEFQQRTSFERSDSIDFSSDMVLGYDLGLGDFGSMAFKIGSYAMAGGSIGSVFPVIGTAIGAIAGALVGVVMTVIGLFSSKSSKIRKAQGKVRDKLEGAREKALDGVTDEARKLVAGIDKELQSGLLKKVNNMQSALQQPIVVFETQITLITRLKNQLEKMPYGTIQTVQY